MYDPYKTINLHSFTATPQWELSFLIKGPHVFQEPLRSIGEMLVEYSGMGVCLGGGVEARKKKIREMGLLNSSQSNMMRILIG